MMVKKKGLVGLGAVALTAAVVLSGCSTSTSGSDDTKASGSTSSLTVWVDSERVDALKGAADDYSEKTGVNVKLVGKDTSTIKDDFIQQVPTGKGPDIVMGAHDWLGELVDQRCRRSARARRRCRRLPPGRHRRRDLRGHDLHAARTRSRTSPCCATPTSSPSRAANFDDMIAKGKAAGLDQPFVVAAGRRGRPVPPVPVPDRVRRSRLRHRTTRATTPTDLQLGSAGGDAVRHLARQPGQNGTGVFNTDIDGDIAKQAFLDGKAAFWLTGPWNVGAATDAGINVAIDPIPSPTGRRGQPFAGVKGFFLSAESKNKVAANDFLVNYIGTEDVQLELFKAGNVLPALTAAAETASTDPIIAGFETVGADAVPMPAIPAMGSVWQFWGIAEAAIINGADPVTTWQKLVDDVQAAIK